MGYFDRLAFDEKVEQFIVSSVRNFKVSNRTEITIDVNGSVRTFNIPENTFIENDYRFKTFVEHQFNQMFADLGFIYIEAKELFNK